jgi:hypothetical protein
MPAGLSSTLIHFAPLLTTTSPCGQYFFFVLFAFFGGSAAPPGDADENAAFAALL